MFRMGLADSRQCECGLGLKDVCHFLFKCPLHDANRNQLVNKIQGIVSSCGKRLRTQMSVTRLLAPSQCDSFTSNESEDILKATFGYIQQSGRHL